jgi:hypothetical protein
VLYDLLHRCISPGKRQTAPRGSPAQQRFRPELVPLEARCLPSTLLVTSLADSGPGTLRGQIAAAAPGDTVQFVSSLYGGTVNLTSGQLEINKNLTILGPANPSGVVRNGVTIRRDDVHATTALHDQLGQ